MPRALPTTVEFRTATVGNGQTQFHATAHYTTITVSTCFPPITEKDQFQDRSFRTFANKPFVFTIWSHLRETPLLPLGWDVPLPFQDPFCAPKILFIYKFGPTSLPIKKVAPLHTHLPQHMYSSFVLFVLLCLLLLFLIWITVSWR